MRGKLHRSHAPFLKINSRRYRFATTPSSQPPQASISSYNFGSNSSAEFRINHDQGTSESNDLRGRSKHAE